MLHLSGYILYLVRHVGGKGVNALANLNQGVGEGRHVVIVLLLHVIEPLVDVVESVMHVLFHLVQSAHGLL